jgi:uncharacterized protein (DUF302 family)
MPRFLLLLTVLLLSAAVQAESPVYKASVKGEFDTVYAAVYEALEQKRMWVVFEPDIGANMKGSAERWGEDYNRNGLERIRSMVFCNAWWANRVANADPDMLALCPLHLSLTHKDGETTVVFLRPDVIARGSAAEAVSKELTELVVAAIEQGLTQAKP